jgi:hypothetical protein
VNPVRNVSVFRRNMLLQHLKHDEDGVSIKALLLFHNDAHNHKITGILKQLKIPTVAPTCFSSRRNHHQGAIFVLS